MKYFYPYMEVTKHYGVKTTLGISPEMPKYLADSLEQGYFRFDERKNILLILERSNDSNWSIRYQTVWTDRAKAEKIVNQFYAISKGRLMNGKEIPLGFTDDAPVEAFQPHEDMCMAINLFDGFGHKWPIAWNESITTYAPVANLYLAFG